MEHDDIELQELIGLIYEAAIEPDLWPELLGRLSVHIDLDAAMAGPVVESPDSTRVRETLTGHFKRASRISKKTSRLNSELDATTSVLNRLPVGVLFVEAGGMVTFANLRASLIFEGDYDLNLVDSHLATSSQSTTGKIFRFIDEILASPSMPGKTIAISNTPPFSLSLSISSLASIKLGQPSGNRYVMVLIATPDAPSHITQQYLQDQYGFTGAEAKFTLALINTNRMEEASKSLFISKHTARSHLKSVFRKTGVNSQSELIKHILTSPEALIASSTKSAMAPVFQDPPWQTMPRHERYIRLYDGRKLGFAEYGDLEGVPVIVNHGAAGSRLQIHPDEDIAISAGVRLIVPDRPGIGLSDFQENRRMMDWPDDIKQLADQLKIKRFGMIGLTTGGSPWALHCAFKIPHLLSGVTIVSGRAVPAVLEAAPAVRTLLGLARLAPSLFYQYLRIMSVSVKKDPEIYLEQRMNDHSEVDRKFLQSQTGKKLFTEPLVEALREGARGVAWDVTIAMQDWEFDMGEISHPIKWWHGTDDLIVPISEAKANTKALSNCETHFIDGEGQYLFINHWREILDEIVQDHRYAH
jgi:pimeloyl-ACP methyl ester carboxylesterase/DNA-binding CsgD family transcriptional regulator